MKKTVLLGIILPLVLTACSIVLASQRFEASAWQEACELSRYSCDDVGPPLVEYDEISRVQGLYGYYMIGTRVVFLSRDLDPDLEYAVLVHEMTHYLQFVNAWANNTPMPVSCVAEREAFEASDKVLKRLGRPELARNGNLKDYGCE